MRSYFSVLVVCGLLLLPESPGAGAAPAVAGPTLDTPPAQAVQDVASDSAPDPDVADSGDRHPTLGGAPGRRVLHAAETARPAPALPGRVSRSPPRTASIASVSLE